MFDLDRSLSILALVAFVLAAAAVGRVSLPFLAVGALATVAFEAVALRHRARVRAIWERPAVQLVALGSGLGLAALGVWFGLEAVISAGIGALGAYLAFSVLVSAGVLEG